MNDILLQDEENISYIIFMSLLTIIALFIAMNYLAIGVSYYILRHEIEEIEDKDLKVNLTHCFNNTFYVFRTKCVFFKESDFFSDQVQYNNLIRYRINCSNTLAQNKQRKDKFVPDETTGEL